MMRVADMETLYEGLALQVLWARGGSCGSFNWIDRNAARAISGRWHLRRSVAEPLHRD